jgi:putative PIN family toxin of toxin-antitoxin system
MNESSARLSAVVEPNLYVSGAISSIGAPRRLLLSWTDKRFHLLLSDEQYNELTEVFQRPKLTRRFSAGADEIATLLLDLRAIPRVDPSPTVPVQVRDPEDVEILAAAPGGNADYLVTGDADLLELRGDPGLGSLRIVTVIDFRTVLDQAASN